MSNNPPTVAFDFDGVISTYEGWKGFDVFGEPIPETIEAIRQLKKSGFYIIIFTSRMDTPNLREWLKKHKVPYDDINQNRKSPPHTSCKPYYHCIVDDRALHFNTKGAYWDTETLIKAITRITNDAMHKGDKNGQN